MRCWRTLVVGLLLLAASAGCRDHQETIPPEMAEALGFSIDRPLEVVLTAPSGPTSGPSDFAEVTVVFNQPMKSLTAESANIATPFTLEPAATGQFRWKGSATVSFVPSQPLRFGTQYRVTVPAGLKAASGKTLERPVEFSFSTPAPQLVRTVPAQKSRTHRAEKPLLLVFDQAVDPAEVMAHLTLDKLGPAGPVRETNVKTTARSLTEAEYRSYAEEGEQSPSFPISRAVAVEASGLTPRASYVVRLAKGLQGKAGPIGSDKEQQLSFTTLAPLACLTENTLTPLPPEDGITLRFNNEVDLKTLKAHLTIEPKVDLALTDYDEEVASADPTLYPELAPNTVYTVTLAPALTDLHGQTLGQGKSIQWKTGDRKPYVQMAEGIGVLEAQGPLSIPMGLRNIDRQTIKLARLEGDEVRRLAAREDGWLYQDPPYVPVQGWNHTSTTKPNAPRNQVTDQALDLRPVLGGRKFGFVLYQVESQAGKETFVHRGLAQVTNLGASAKFSPENSLFVATSLDKAALLSGVEAFLLDGAGRTVWKGKTGKDGRLEAPGWTSLLGRQAETYDAPPLSLFLQSGQDQVFVRNGAFGTVSPWSFDINTRWDNTAHQPTAFAYTERGLYLPGEEVQLRGAVRDRVAGKWSPLQSSDVAFELFNSRDESLEEGRLKLSDFGTFHHTLSLPGKTASGHYRVEYRLPPEVAKQWNIGEFLTGVSFRVEEFQPADFQVEVDSSQKTPKMGDTVALTVKSQWLFGAPLQNEKLRWSGYLSPARYSHESYPGFDFGPQALEEESPEDHHQDLSSGVGRTGADGLFKTELKLAGIPLKGDADLTIEATVASPNRREVTGRLTLPVSRGAYRLGLSPTTRFASAGQPTSVALVALDPSGQPVQGKSVELELVRRQWNSVRKSDVDGSFRWVSQVEDSSVSTQVAISARGASEVSVTPKQAGYHVLKATSNDGAGNTVVSETGFYVSGSGEVPWERFDGDAIELVPDKPSYQPGETAKVLIKSPFSEATAVISYERDLVLHSYTTTLKGSTPIIEVPLTEEHLPNLYVSVMLLRGRVADVGAHPEEDPGKPAFKIGYIDLPVASDSQRLKVEMTTDQARYGPGDEVAVSLQVTDAQGQPVEAELSLTAADVGVLSLVDYQTPDFFDTFYASLPLSVRTCESRLDVIGQRSYGGKGESQGGGGGYSSDYRDNFRYTALWKPEVRTDAQGKAEVRFKLADNLTTFRLMATAISKDTRCGKSQGEIVVSKPLVLKRSAPAFARVGDQFQAGVLAVNNSDTDSTLKLTLETEGLDGAPHSAKEIVIKAGEEREVLFALKASQEGLATLRFQGDMTPETDALAYEIPVSQAAQRVVLASSGSTTEASHKDNIAIPSETLSNSATVQVSLAPTVLGGLQPSLDALLDSPYHSLEQRLSRLTPLLHGEMLVTRLGLTGWQDGKAKAAVISNLGAIPSYLDSSSQGLKMWPDSTEPNPYLTALAVRTAHLAEENGYQVPGTWLASARGYLKRYLEGSEKSLLDLSEAEQLASQAAALEALARYDFRGRPFLSRLMARREKMALTGKAHLLEAAHRLGDQAAVKTLSQELTNAMKVENATAYFDVMSDSPWLYSSKVRDTALVLSALLDSGQKPPAADKVVRWLLEARGAKGDWNSSAESSAALGALWAYAETFEGKTAPKFAVTVKVNGQPSESVSFAPDQRSPQVKDSPLKSGENLIELVKEGSGRLYYTIAASYLDTRTLPAVDEGITVMRALTTTDDKAVTSLRAGEMYKLKLSVVAPAARRFVALADPLPAGLEVVHTDFATESKRLSALLNSSAPHRTWQTFCRFETYSDRILLFADTLAPGEHTYEYLVRAQAPGTYLHPAAQAEEMYHPEVFGRTSTGRLTVE